MGLLKSNTDLRHLKLAAKLAGEICEELLQACEPGMATAALAEKAELLLRQNRSSAPFKHFDGFGHPMCVSVNEEIVNGPPKSDKLINSGDVVSVAIGTEIRGIHGKAARSRYLGTPIPPEVAKLLDGTSAVFKTIAANPTQWKTLNDLLQEIPNAAANADLTVIHGTGGNGIGKRMHEDLPTPNDPSILSETIPLTPGLAFTLMPMLSLGENPETVLANDGWTWVTQDNSLSAHIAETVLMTENGLEILSTSHT
ncbi:MAG: M24 family metallopeptidase [Vampirovibrio sp.]|nr:M24 family metallopeptidase [Vampirovibrio sp.]